MIRLISILLFGLLFIGAQSANCVPVPLENAEKPVSEENSNYTKDIEDEDFNFDDNSFNISDEQSQVSKQAPEEPEVEEKEDFDVKIINSSHFSSGTATKTWIPLNKNK